MNQFVKYIKYANAYLIHGDVWSIIDSIRFIIFKKGASKNRFINCHLGIVKVRKGTNDFQFANYYYEWSVKSYILSIYKNYNVFFDFGAGIGDYSLLLAKRGLRCFAFEPIINNYETMVENIKLNQLSQLITTYQLALSNQEKKVEFTVKSVNTGASHRSDLMMNTRINDDVYEMVNESSLDHLYHDFGLIENDRILIKMDMEGMEIEGLLGATEFINKYPNITIIAEAKHCSNDKLIETLQSIANFRVDQLDEMNIYAIKTSNKTQAL